MIGFDGNLNTGLTLRTVHLHDGVAEVRAGATLLYDSDPDAEERETRVKASAFLDAISAAPKPVGRAHIAPVSGAGASVLLLDHEDSFVHTLANYLRQTGASVITLRRDQAMAEIDQIKPNLVVLSPGPGTPQDFKVADSVGEAIKRDIPVFGVCLGLQGVVEHFGGELGVLGYPMHGKPSVIRKLRGPLFEGFPDSFTAARYHSLFAKPESMPDELSVVAESEDGIIMAVEHKTLPIRAVQFHPESILSETGGHGLALLGNLMNTV